MAETFGLATYFQITEMDGESRTLLLAGRALPYRPYTLSGSQRAEFTWYPGNPHATVQVLGAEEKPTTITGMWKDRFIKESTQAGGQETFTAIAKVDDVQVASADALARIVDDFRRQGQLLVVRWGNQIRHGILTDFTAKYDRLEDVEWEMTFGWTSQGDVPSSAVISGQTDLGRIKSSWDQQADALDAAKLDPPFDIGALEDAINEQIDVLQERINEVTDAVSSVANAVSSASDMASRLNSVYESIKDACTDLLDTVTSVPPLDVFVLSGSDLQDGEPTFTSSLLAESWVESLTNVVRSARRQAAENQSDLASTISSDLLSVYVAKAGDDLRGVSTDFYNTPNAWRRLMLYNKLSQSELAAGQIVLVPRLQAGDV